MGDGKWFRRIGRRAMGGTQQPGGQPSRKRAKRASWLASAANRCALSFESLEDRRLLATFVVTEIGDLDNGAVVPGTLRWAINQANATAVSDQIVFSENIFSFGTTSIGLDGGELSITNPVRILGPGARKLEISQGTGDSRVFNINIGTETSVPSVEISGVTISGGGVSGDGDAGKGGGIFNRETLLLKEVVITGNFASGGGGGVYTAFGSTTLVRSLVVDNSTGGDGGGMLNGRTETMNLPTTTITNSTIARNTAGNWGGGLMNRNGTLVIQYSTITDNRASSQANMGGGVASFGNQPPAKDEPPPDVPPPALPAPTVFTRVYSSIIFGNTRPMGMDTDFDKVGMTADSPPRELNPSITSLGYNIVGSGNSTVPDAMPPEPSTPAPVPADDQAFKVATNDKVGVDPKFKTNAMGQPLGLQDFGGSTDVYLLDPTSPAIDGGRPMDSGGGQPFEQRGRHFTRVFNFTGLPDDIIDIGAVEMQEGQFEVDTLVDETDSQYTEIYSIEEIFGQDVYFIQTYEGPGDFSLREAIEFATKNPGLDTITFTDELNSEEILEDEDLTASPAPTIVLSLGALSIDNFTGYNEDLDIIGPEGFVLEIDARGNDPNPATPGSNGSRVFEIDDFDSLALMNVTMSNLTIMGGDFTGVGGGMLSRENVLLSQVTFKDNNATNDGGGLFVPEGTIEIVGTTFNNNRAGDDGAAIFITGGADVTVINSTISGNIAGDRGAGIFNEGSTLLVEYSTITLNVGAPTRGSGITNSQASALTQVRGTIISDNSSDNDVDANTSPSTPITTFQSLGYNFIGKGNAKSRFNQPGDQIDQINPMLEPLSNTGGLVQTHRPVYNLSTGVFSPVIDAGDPAAPNAPASDGRGSANYLRIFDVSNVTRAGKGPIDIGAYELQGVTFLVDSFSDDNDGVISFGNFTLREAIELANINPLRDVIEFDPFLFGSTIFLGSGTITPGTPADLRITSPMTFRLPAGESLTIDGSGLDNPSTTIDGSRMFTIDDGVTTVHSDVEFIGGFEFRGARAPQAGSVIWSRENLTLEDATFINNETRDPVETPTVDLTGLHGGAIYQEGTGSNAGDRPTLTIRNGLFTGNSTNDVNADGGAIYVVDAEFILEGTTVAGNLTSMSSSDGGAIALKNATFTSSDSTITANFSQAGSSDGGGLYSENSVVTLSNFTVVSGNQTTGSNSEGGGIYGVGSQITINDSVVSENDTIGTQSSGAGIYVTGAAGVLTLNRSLVQENTAIGISAHGGGIALNGGTAFVEDTTVQLNSISGSNANGGGIWNNGGVLTLRGATIASNQATHTQSKGGGVYSDTNLAGSQSTVILNSTVSGNSATSRGGGVFNADGRTDIQHSTITNNSTAAINTGSGVASLGNIAATLTNVQYSIIAENVGAPGTRTDIDAVDGAGNSFTSLGYNLIGVGNALADFNQPTDQTGVADAGLAPLADNGAPAGATFELQTHALLPNSFAINAGNPLFNPGVFSPSLLFAQNGVSRVLQGVIDIGAFESDSPTPQIADFDNDSDVDGADFLTWQRNLGRTNASLSQGDATGDGVVNGQDLTAWRNTFGTGSSGAAGAAAASSAGASEAAQSAAVEGEPTSSADENDFGSLAALGTPGSAAQRASTVKAYHLQESSNFAAADGPAATALAWDATGGYSTLESEDDFESLLAEDDGDADGAAEDAVFAAWGDELLF